MGDGGGGHWLIRMEWRPAGWSVCLPLLIFPCIIKSRNSLLPPAHPGGPGKRAIKRLCVRVRLYGAREDNRGRHNDHLADRHSIWINERPNSIIPPFVRQMPFLPQPSHFILAWDRHQICWPAYSVAWFSATCWQRQRIHFPHSFVDKVSQKVTGGFWWNLGSR